MEHAIVLREKGRCTAFPILDQLPDSRLSLADVLTAYCITPPGGTTHLDTTRWHPDKDGPT